MRIKKWEKIYWSIILLLALLITIAAFTDKLSVKWNGKEVNWSNTKKFLIVVPSLLGISLIIWLIVRFFGSGEKE
ncbi:hypothetical protein [endosymbiont DhMRE of Dentiscutata heterogama]|uniref:hypothetical protein n=1 Tax=endosymbiont DhMRE of Dentiscutata heterogama TaxID=1609546 RepID=UPI002AD4E18C|nr:hypothetical protein [endosymbiont DhMRE of Dentiscutata heterogama]